MTLFLGGIPDLVTGPDLFINLVTSGTQALIEGHGAIVLVLLRERRTNFGIDLCRDQTALK